LSKDKFIDLSDDLDESYKAIKKTGSKFRKLKKSLHNDFNEIGKLESELANISKATSIPLSIPKKKTRASTFKWDDKFFLDNNPMLLETKIKNEIYKNPKLLPPLSNLEYGIIGLTGAIASTIDLLMVKIPKNVNYLNKFQQEGSEFTTWLHTLGVNEVGELNPFLKWLEDKCKTPYDQSQNNNIEGFYPRTHRLLSLAHDPLLGLIFGIIDILMGTMTAFDIKGKIHVIKSFDLIARDKILSPFLWLGHIVSDMCTKMGVPVPGGGFLQILQFGSFGAKSRTIADISRWMYLNGYDLRHFITMSIPVAVIEIIIRAYHYLSSLSNQEELESSISLSLMSKELAQVESNLKLHKMLFFSHSIAASGNALKVFVYSGNPLAINAEQWIFFIKESIKITRAINRDKIPEKIVRNRKIIDDEWEVIKDIGIGQFEFLKQDSTIYHEIYLK
jgi:hypothetical protein